MNRVEQRRILASRCGCCAGPMRSGAVKIDEEYWCETCSWDFIIYLVKEAGISIPPGYENNHTLFYTKFLYPYYRHRWHLSFVANYIARLDVR